jgi:DNA polymerase-1
MMFAATFIGVPRQLCFRREIMREGMAQTGDDNVLYLIDGHAQIFRAYHAIRGGMTSPVTGEPAGAVFAFVGMMLKLLEQCRPRFVAMAIDLPGPTFRDEMYPAYKATREPPPEDFHPQEQRIFEIVRLFRVPILGVEGAEADDVIATVVERALSSEAHRDLHIRIVSRDKDLEQLLGPRVTMYDIHTDVVVDVDALGRDKGIRPEQVVDVLALMGDHADNIPGVDGIGPKTAAALIHEFGSIDGVYAHLDQIKGKRRENLEKARAHIDLSRRLVQLKRDVVFPFAIADAQVGKADVEALRRMFRELGFNRHLTDLDRVLAPGSSPSGVPAAPSQGRGTKSAKPQARQQAQGGLFAGLMEEEEETPASAREEDPSGPEGHGLEERGVEGHGLGGQGLLGIALTRAGAYDYRAVTDAPGLRALVAAIKAAKLVSVDTETIGLGHRAALCGLSFAWESGHGVYVPVRAPEGETCLTQAEVLEALRGVLEDPGIAKCGHNLKYDMLVLRAAGVTLRGVVFDSMIAAFLAGAPGIGLDALAQSVLHHQMIPITDLIGPKPTRKSDPPQGTMDAVPLKLITPYAAEDADITLRLTEHYQPMLQVMGMTELVQRVEMPLVEVLADMEHAGITVDREILDEQAGQLQQRIAALRDQVHEAAGVGFNVDSPKQLAQVLFKTLKLPVVKRTKTGPSTDIEVLEKLAEMEGLDAQAAKVPALVVEYRQLTKLVSTYLVALKEAIDPSTGRVHATFHQTGAATGRLSSSDPNLQNIPIRSEVGRQIRKAFVAARDHRLVCADYSQIELRILAHLSGDQALIEAFRGDQDIHTAVAAQVFNVTPEAVTRAQRGHAKVVNFGIIYGVTPYGLARRIEGLDVEAAKALIAGYKAKFAGIDRFLGQCVDQALRLGYVTTMLGRRRLIPQIESSNGQTRALGERLAINTVVQGSAADLIKLAMVNLYQRIRDERLPMRLLLQIHDELVVETPAAEADRAGAVVREAMEGAMALKVPLRTEVGVGKDWFAAK